jgi:hypothetical protein
VVAQVRIFHEDASRACKAHRVIQRVQLHPVSRSWAPIFPRSSIWWHTRVRPYRGGKRKKSAPTSDEDDSPSMVVAEKDFECEDTVLGVAPEWER